MLFNRLILVLIVVCTFGLLVGSIIGYIIGKIAPRGENERNTGIVEMAEVEQPKETTPDIESTAAINATNIESKIDNTPYFESLGVFKTTAYCPCVECSDEYGRQTSTGAIATQGITVAVDPTVIPYGSILLIDGKTYIAQDCGGLIKGNVIDIYFDSHKDTVNYGIQQHEVFILREGKEIG